MGDVVQAAGARRPEPAGRHGAELVEQLAGDGTAQVHVGPRLGPDEQHLEVVGGEEDVGRDEAVAVRPRVARHSLDRLELGWQTAVQRRDEVEDVGGEVVRRLLPRAREEDVERAARLLLGCLVPGAHLCVHVLKEPVQIGTVVPAAQKRHTVGPVADRSRCHVLVVKDLGRAEHRGLCLALSGRKAKVDGQILVLLVCGPELCAGNNVGGGSLREMMDGGGSGY